MGQEDSRVVLCCNEGKGERQSKYLSIFSPYLPTSESLTRKFLKLITKK